MAVVVKIEKECKVRLRGPQDIQNFLNLEMDRSQFAAVLWLLVQSQANQAGISQDQFYDGLDAAAFDSAWLATTEAFILYCPSHVHGSLRDAIVQHKTAQQAAAEQVSKFLESDELKDKISKSIEAETDRLFKELLKSA